MCINSLLENLLYVLFDIKNNLSENSMDTGYDTDSSDSSVINTIYSSSNIPVISEVMDRTIIEPIYTKEEIIAHLMDILDAIKTLYPHNIMLMNLHLMDLKLAEQYDSYLKLLDKEAIQKIKDFENNIFSYEQDIDKKKWIHLTGVDQDGNIIYMDGRYENAPSHIFRGIRHGVVETSRIQFSPDVKECSRYTPRNFNDIIYTIHYLSYMISFLYEEQAIVTKSVVFDFKPAIKI